MVGNDVGLAVVGLIEGLRVGLGVGAMVPQFGIVQKSHRVEVELV